MIIKIVPYLEDNYAYLLHDPVSQETAVIDPGAAQPVLSALAQEGWSLSMILCTHHHYDHIGGIEELMRATGVQRILCSSYDKTRIPFPCETVQEGAEKLVCGQTMRVMETPGHTIGHLAYYFPVAGAVFTGDTLFSLGCGRLFEGTFEQMWSSLRRLGDLPRATQVYCGHEYTEKNAKFALHLDPHNLALKNYAHRVHDLRRGGQPTVPSTIEIELLCNPFLRAGQLANTLRLHPNTPVAQAFAAVRQKKDDWG